MLTWPGPSVREADAGRRSRSVRTPGFELEPVQPRTGCQPWDATPLRDRLAVDLLQVAREIDRLRARDIRTDGERVNRRCLFLEEADAPGLRPPLTIMRTCVKPS